MHPGDRARFTAELLPIADAADGHLHSLLLGELKLATRFVVTEGDRSPHHRDLNHPLAHLLAVSLLDRVVRSGEIHGAIDEGFAAGTGTHRLVVHLDSAGAGELGEPALIHLGGEGGPRRIEAGHTGTAATGSEANSENAQA